MIYAALETWSNDYLGDGVYISKCPTGLVITTGHHDPARAENTIWLEDQVALALMRYLKNEMS